MTGGVVIPPGAELPAMDAPSPNGGIGAARRRARSSTPPPKRAVSNIRRRFGLLNAIIDRAMPKMARSELAVWLLLYRHAKPDGTVSASVGDLARRTGSGDRSVRYALDRMRDAGLLRRLKRGTLAGGPSVYRLLHPPD